MRKTLAGLCVAAILLLACKGVEVTLGLEPPEPPVVVRTETAPPIAGEETPPGEVFGERVWRAPAARSEDHVFELVEVVLWLLLGVLGGEVGRWAPRAVRRRRRR